MTARNSHWAIILHGGAHEIAPEQEEAHRNGAATALVAGRNVLKAGGTALDAVETVVRALEDDPTFNAGYGSVLNADGNVEMDAAIMDGRTLDIGAVACIRGVRHPVSVAKAMLRHKPILLVAEGAHRFAEQEGMELCNPADMIAPQRKDLSQNGHDTVGCLALDVSGNMAVATSTGGLKDTIPGRIGDAPIPGCGFYVRDGIGAVALSGEGESIARILMAAQTMRALEEGIAPQQAVEQVLNFLEKSSIGGEVGGIVLDAEGRIGWAHNAPHFTIAYATAAEDQVQVFLTRDEARR